MDKGVTLGSVIEVCMDKGIVLGSVIKFSIYGGIVQPADGRLVE